jgi:hypothetical protein
VALATYAGDAFDTFCEFPDFIRLVIQENLQGARFIGKSPAIREMNEGTFALLKELLQRGQADGSMRAELTPLNVYINFIGLCHYNISSRSTFLALFGHDLTLPQHRAARRESICDAIVRYARS